MAKPRVVVFLDANVNPAFKEAIEKELSPSEIKIILMAARLRNYDDSSLLAYFEQETRKRYQLSHVFVLTHDQDFERDSSYKISSRVAVIQISQAPIRSGLAKTMIAELISLFNYVLKADRLSRFRGVIKFE